VKPPLGGARWVRQVRRDWNRAATAWERWETQVLHSLAAVDPALLRALALRPGQRVLDFGCGSGEPALAIAELVSPRGSGPARQESVVPGSRRGGAPVPEGAPTRPGTGAASLKARAPWLAAPPDARGGIPERGGPGRAGALRRRGRLRRLQPRRARLAWVVVGRR